MSITTPAAGVDVGSIFNDAMNAGSSALTQAGNLYQQAQQAFGSRRETQGNPYANIPSPWDNNTSQQQAPQQAYLQPSYSYGYSGSNNGFGYAAPQGEVGIPGYTNPMYGKGGY